MKKRSKPSPTKLPKKHPSEERKGPHLPAAPEQPADKPALWDFQTQTLFFRGRAVKHFDRAAPDQFQILEEFQRNGWPPRIDISLPGRNHRDFSARLRRAVSKLKHGQEPQVLEFAMIAKTGVLCWPRTRGAR